MVYLLDDDADMLKALSRILRAHGFQVTSFEKAQDFFEHEQSTGAACLVLDLAMPGLDGLEVQQKLVDEQNRLPIIFLTGHGDVVTSVKAMKAGAEDFLTKPIEGADLVAAVQVALERSKVIQAEDTEIAELKLRLERLTPRQYEVFQYVIAGKMNKNIAAEIGTGEQNVKVHRRRVMRKMGVKSLADLVRMAERLGIEPVT